MKRVIISTAPLPARIFPVSLGVTIGTNSSRTLTVVIIAVTVIMECY